VDDYAFIYSGRLRFIKSHPHLIVLLAGKLAAACAAAAPHYKKAEFRSIQTQHPSQ
jgi:hypothetical protein